MNDEFLLAESERISVRGIVYKPTPFEKILISGWPSQSPFETTGAFSAKWSKWIGRMKRSTASFGEKTSLII